MKLTSTITLLALVALAPFFSPSVEGQTGPDEAALLVSDVSGHERYLTVVNASTSEAIQYDDSLDSQVLTYHGFGGTTALPDTQFGRSFSEATLAAWWRTDESASSIPDRLFAWKSSSANNRVRMGLNVQTGDTVTCIFDTTAASGQSSSTTVLQLGVWYHIACVKTATAVETWVNGSLEGTALLVGANDGTGLPIILGWNPSGTGSQLCSSCYADDIRIYLDEAYGSADINAMMTNTSAPTDGLEAFWTFEDRWDYGPPIAAFVALAQSNNVSVNASASYSRADPQLSLTFSWDWGDGSPSSTGINAFHSYTFLGDYQITLNVSEDTTEAYTLISHNVSALASSTTVVGDVVLSTAFDSWLPVVVWGGALLLFLWLDALFPAVACALVLANSMVRQGFGAGLWGFQADVMVVAVSVLLHATVAWLPGILDRMRKGEVEINGRRSP